MLKKIAPFLNTSSRAGGNRKWEEILGKSDNPFFEHSSQFFGGGDVAPPTQACGQTAVLSSPSLPGSARTRPLGKPKAGTPLPRHLGATAHAPAPAVRANRVLRKRKKPPKPTARNALRYRFVHIATPQQIKRRPPAAVSTCRGSALGTIATIKTDK